MSQFHTDTSRIFHWASLIMNIIISIRLFNMAFALACFVTVPRTEILGEPDRYVKAGSNVVLRCIVRGALEPPTFIMWYHGAEQLAADSRRHRTQLDPNLPEASGEGQSTVSSANCSLVDFNLITLDFKLLLDIFVPVPMSLASSPCPSCVRAKLQYYFIQVAFMSHSCHAPNAIQGKFCE